jgi:hypothetical protein
MAERASEEDRARKRRRVAEKARAAAAEEERVAAAEEERAAAQDVEEARLEAAEEAERRAKMAQGGTESGTAPARYRRPRPARYRRPRAECDARLDAIWLNTRSQCVVHWEPGRQGRAQTVAVDGFMIDMASGMRVENLMNPPALPPELLGAIERGRG